MSGYQTIEALRPILRSGPPATPVVDVALVTPRNARQVKLNKNTSPNNATISIMRAMRRDGKSLSTIAKKTGFANPTIRRHTADILPPEGGWPHGGHTSKFDAKREFAGRLHRSGFTFAEIGDELGCSAAWAHRLVRGDRRTRKGPSTKTAKVVLAVSKATGVPCERLRKAWGDKGHCQPQPIAKARAIVFWILKDARKASFASIGRSLGGFNHTTVRHGYLRAAEAILKHGIQRHPHDGRIAGQLWRMSWPELPK